jgi:hypothetical protein
MSYRRKPFWHHDIAQDVMVIGRHVALTGRYDISARRAGYRLWRGGKADNASEFTLKDVARVMLAISKRRYYGGKVDCRALMAVDRLLTFFVYHHPVKLPWHAFPDGWPFGLSFREPYDTFCRQPPYEPAPSTPYDPSRDWERNDDVRKAGDEALEQWLNS